MLNENAKKWVEALRSGKYKQTKHMLERPDGSCCCLGVACRVAIENGVELNAEQVLSGRDDCIAFGGETLSLPKSVQDWLGLKDREGMLQDPLRSTLSGKNDVGATFSEIADIIESEPEGLFV